MGFSCGIVGLPNGGKSTIFNALTAAGSAVAPYAFCTIDPKEGVVAVPDHRLRKLENLVEPETCTPTTLKFVDIAGLVEGASRGEGLGNRFLAHIRETDAMVFVLRAFQDGNVPHSTGTIEPMADLDVLRTELALADLESVERAIEKRSKLARVGDKAAGREAELLGRVQEALDQGRFASTVALNTAAELEVVGGLFLLTRKPWMIVLNLGEDDLPGEAAVASLAARLPSPAPPIIPVCGKLEAELAELEDPDEMAIFLADLGLKRSALERVVLEGYGILDLITFYTQVGTELRAWTLPRGTAAAKAAGRIHTDMEAGFIKAEVIPYDDFLSAGSEARARDQGRARIEGRDYPVMDGDIVRFHFR